MPENNLLFSRENFSICVLQDAFEVIIASEKFFTLPVRSSLSLENQEDIDDCILIREHEEGSGEDKITWITKSNLWERKEYILKIDKDNFYYSIRVLGKGSPAKIQYFSGDTARKKLGASYDTAGYMLPQPKIGIENHYFTMAQDNEISMQLMVPPPLCFPFFMEGCPNWFGLGLVGNANEYNFDAFKYENHKGNFILCVNLYARTAIDGEWTSPGILGSSGSTQWDILCKYANWHYNNNCKPIQSEIEAWWKGPYFCGWGEQAILAKKYHQSIYDAANQKVYTEISEHLDELGLNPSAIIIDDKWQNTYGENIPDTEKWPNMRRFVDKEHSKGRKVLLWFKCWSSEGLPADECITLWSQPVAADPTNPKYIKRLKETIHYLLSNDDGCCDCDGFKIDFADTMPRTGEMVTFEKGICGIELLKRLLSIIYKSAKETKRSALINCSGCHPYLAEVTNQVRLHDYDYRLRSVKSCMDFRKQLYEAVLPMVLIDTDFPAFAGHKDSMAYIRYAPTIGVPDLYRISDTEECIFTDEDWKEIREIWAAYKTKIN